MPAAQHPFPPVVRWGVAPGLLCGAGAVAGACAFAVDPGLKVDRLMLIGVGFAASAWLGLATTSRLWLGPLVAVLAGVSLLAGLFAVYESLHAGVPVSPWERLAWMLANAEARVCLGCGIGGLALGAQLFASGRRIGSLIVWAGSGLAWGSYVHVGPDTRAGILVFAVLLGVLHWPALAAVKALADRLDRRAPSP